MSRYSKHIIIVGSARSGTSWLSETIAQQNRYRMLFEPEHETQTEKGHLLCDKWLEETSEAKKANRYLKQVFANRVDNDWIAQNSNRKWKRHLWPFIPKKYIIKFVRANLAAKYMNETFEIPLIHLLRNPYDTLYSQQRNNFPWLIDLSHFQEQEKLVELIKNRFDFNITDVKALSKLETLTVRWCIENVLPLEVLQPYQGRSKVIRYEALRKDIAVFHEICNYFVIEPIKNIEEVYTKPSSKTHHKSSIVTKEKKEVTFTSNELQQINSILDIFKTKLYPRIH
ncbi:sulfotransferase domain-containing protein [Marixanthomonas ophiurae]|uniref:Sulfotransferase family protein n=1 Tax=Marixanthomonas ophiurae TaxID=387659 RepID=A0A3E1QD17_9FLAO|nr:sulfotransferase domain-containing protein [Marixanthomonas ophiurae]RFN60051.1 sulfotransferase family protein [Marixanthomonas ophiurae]